jgi:tetratricopeptide (TPR) repeat protein
MKRLRSLALVVVLGGCAYYNAMWSAEQYAKGARKFERQGQASEARSQWAQAAAKAEAVVAKHPRSRWADDALVLQAEGLARSGSCDEADEVIVRARVLAKDNALRERVELAEAQCALAAGRPVQAEAAVRGVLSSRDQTRRSRAEYFAGVAAGLRLDHAAAVEHFRRSREPAARPARAYALLELGRAADAAAVIDEIGADPTLATERADLLSRLSVVGGPELASATLDRLLTRRVPFAEQARLLIADGDRRAAHGHYQEAEARYQRAISVGGLTSNEAATAHVRMQRLTIMQATQRSDLVPVIEELRNLSQGERANTEAKQLLDQVTPVTAQPPSSAGARFHIAERVRDSLGAPALAGQLFLDVAGSDTGSLYAPKALVAALALLPGRRDSIITVLDTRYAGSPYTRAFHGEVSVAYAVAEDSLARELGVEVARAASGPSSGLRFAPPIPRVRGPRLEEPVTEPAGPQPARTAPPPRPGARPVPANTPRDRPAATQRP